MSFETERNPPPLPLQRLSTGANLAQAGLLLVAFAGLLALALWPGLGAMAIIIALLAAAAIVALAVRTAPEKLMQIYGARPYQAGDLAQFDRLTAELAGRAGLVRPPRLYVVPSMLLSAFSIGSSQHAAIAVTEGLLRRLTMREIAAVLALEISHVRRGDPLALGIADLVTRCAQGLYFVGLGLTALNVWRLIIGEELVSWWSVALLILTPALLNILQLALSRSSEFEADRAAALLTGDPLGLASAVSRLDAPPGDPLEDLIPPVPARKVPLPSMLRYPPPADRRIARLNALQAPPMPPLDIADGPRISLVGVGPIEMRPRYRWPGIWF
jgi:heat shock protein HtpX